MDAMPGSAPCTIFNFDARHPPIDGANTFATGSDKDIGGLSTCALTPVPADEGSGSPSHMAFHGNLSLRVPPKFAGRIRTGYAAFRNKSRPTLFGEETWDLEMYSHLRVEVAYRGWEGWRSRWVMNLQTDGPVR
jgi:NADH dehydrogenase [ubiquinone] 1 alpha subcomplex assembly factor 1